MRFLFVIPVLVLSFATGSHASPVDCSSDAAMNLALDVYTKTIVERTQQTIAEKKIDLASPLQVTSTNTIVREVNSSIHRPTRRNPRAGKTQLFYRILTVNGISKNGTPLALGCRGKQHLVISLTRETATLTSDRDNEGIPKNYKCMMNTNTHADTNFSYLDCGNTNSKVNLTNVREQTDVADIELGVVTWLE